MSENPTLKKLRLKSGQHALVLGAPESFRRLIDGADVSVELTGTPDASFDFIQVFVTTRAELEALGPVLRAAARPDTLLWISYPKGTALPTDLKRDVVWAALDAFGLRPCAQIAIDEVWSALRFRPA
jgi:hypothetical protein